MAEEITKDIQMRLKLEKARADIYSKMFSKLVNNSRRIVDYPEVNPGIEVRSVEFVTNIADQGKWDYSGLVAKEDIHLLAYIEYFLNDREGKVQLNPEWEPFKG